MIRHALTLQIPVSQNRVCVPRTHEGNERRELGDVQPCCGRSVRHVEARHSAPWLHGGLRECGGGGRPTALHMREVCEPGRPLSRAERSFRSTVQRRQTRLPRPGQKHIVAAYLYLMPCQHLIFSWRKLLKYKVYV